MVLIQPELGKWPVQHFADSAIFEFDFDVALERVLQRVSPLDALKLVVSGHVLEGCSPLNRSTCTFVGTYECPSLGDQRFTTECVHVEVAVRFCAEGMRFYDRLIARNSFAGFTYRQQLAE